MSQVAPAGPAGLPDRTATTGPARSTSPTGEMGPRGGPPPLGPVGLMVRGVGEVLITAGVVVLLFVAYQLYWTDLLNNRTQARLHREFQSALGNGSGAPSLIADTGGVDLKVLPLRGNIAEIFIPRLGRAYNPVMVEGTDEGALQLGPGHYTGTALPGQPGNFAVAGHRTTYGQPLNRLAEVVAGDHVVFRTRDAWVTYLVTGETVVAADGNDGVAIDARPPTIGDQRGSDRLLTMTTCNPKYSASQRLILRGIWVSTDRATTGFMPAALRPGAL